MRRLPQLLPLLVLPLLALQGPAACSSEGAKAAPEGSDDANGSADAAADGSAESDTAVADTGSGEGSAHDTTGDTNADADTSPPVYERQYTLTENFPAPNGKVWRRSIVHLHSTHSHDACDGNPRVDGQYNFPCIASLRAALCKTRIDVANLTDHPDLFAETPWPDVLLFDPATDQLLTDADGRRYNEMRCPDGFIVNITAGMESALMPIQFRGPLSEDVEENKTLLSGSDGVAMTRFRDGGALAWVAHTESKTLEELEDLQVGGLEIYNLHANIDPDIRPLLGLDPFGFAGSVFPFIGGGTRANPDFALLGFLEPNQNALDKWAVVNTNRLVVGTGGTDAHENTLPQIASDGERMDSYRRMIGWFGNYVLADDASFPAYRAALASGRSFLGFDTLGDPAGFDAAAFDAAGTRYEMGGSFLPTEGAYIRAQVPQISTPEGGNATIRTLLFRSTGTTWELVGEGGVGEVRFPITAPGIYRVEVRMTPTHLTPFLERLTRLANRELPWIYSNPFRLVAP